MRDLLGTGALLRFALRRDRWLLPAWIIGLALVPTLSAASVKDLYPTELSRVEAAETMNATASLIALYGKIYDPTSIGALSLIKMTAFGSALVAVVLVFLTVRHTRTEEEAGRVELLASGVVGRDAPLTSALLVDLVASVGIGVLSAVGLVAVGMPVSGSLAFGLSWTLTGLVFVAVAAVAAQLTVSHRTAIGIGVGTVGIAYVLRAIGDLAAGDPGAASWLSPIGWSQQIRPFAGDRWWVVVIPVAVTGALVVGAYALRAQRDLGAGLLPQRRGPAHGRIGSIGGLGWRLQRGTLLAWLLGLAATSILLGSMAHTVTGLLSSPAMQQYLVALGGEQGFVDAFLAAEIALVGALVGAYAVSAVSRLHAEESAGHAELLLSTATTRTGWAASHYLLAIIGIAVMLLVAGAATGLGHGLAIGDPVGQMARLTVAAAATVPAAWVMAGLVLVLVGWLPRWVAASWGLFVAFLVLGEFGALWNLPTWALDLSPFAHSPRLPAADFAAGSLLGLVAVSAALTGLGIWGLRRRDID